MLLSWYFLDFLKTALQQNEDEDIIYNNCH